eukprot:1159929-Pelagomonas_calceolata.AAC.21
MQELAAIGVYHGGHVRAWLCPSCDTHRQGNVDDTGVSTHKAWCNAEVDHGGHAGAWLCPSCAAHAQGDGQSTEVSANKARCNT